MTMSDPTPPAAPTASLPPRVAMTPAQLLADNFSTRLREMSAFVAFVLLAKWGLIPGTWAAVAIGAIVVPIEITRQIIKVPVARLGGGGAALALGAVVLHKVLTYGAIAGVVLATMQGCAAGQHPRPWYETAQAAVVASAHAVDAADAVVAARYTQQAADAGDLAAFDHRFARAVAARRVAREALLGAEVAVAAGRAADAAPARCRASLVLDAAGAELAHLAAALVAADADPPADMAPALALVIDAARALAPSCGDADAGR